MRLVHHQIRAALYARVSSDQQAEAGTIASQVEDLKGRANADGCPVEQQMCFLDEGYSGSTLVRPALERLRDLVAEGAIDRLYVHSPDRLARKYAYQVLLVDELKRQGVEIVFLNRELGRTPEDDLLLQVQGMVAEYERAKILERSRRGKLHAAREGNVSVLSGAPHGYRYINKREGNGQARYEVILEEARTVRQLFAWIGLERCSIGEVCRRLRKQNIASPKGKECWDRSTILGILRNAAYRGDATYGKTQIGELRKRLRPGRGQAEQPRRAYSVYDTPERGVPIAVPALVSEELFAAVAEQLQENRQRARQRARGARYLLQGLLVCGQCGYAYYGKPVSRKSAKGAVRRYAYYRCTGTDAYRFGGQRVCQNKQVRTDLLEKAVWDDVCALLKDPGRIEAEYRRRLDNKTSAKQTNGREQLETLIGKVKRGIGRLLDAYGEGLMEKEEFEPRIRQFRERLSRLEADLQQEQELEKQEQQLRLVIGQLQDFAQRVNEDIAEADWSTRREIIRTLVKQVEIDDQEVRVIYRVSLSPFVDGPERGCLPDCRRGAVAATGQPVYATIRRRLAAKRARAAVGRSHHQLCG